MLRDFAVNIDAGMEGREKRLVEAIEHYNTDEPIYRDISRRTFEPVRVVKLAIATTVLIAAGYFAGRLLAPPPVDIERLQTVLEPAIRQSVIEQIKLDRELVLEHHIVRLKEDLSRQFHRDLKECAASTLAASRVTTEQRLAELIRLIEAARTVDHYQVAVALERIESNRLQDKTRFGDGLVRLAAHGNEMLGTQQESPNQRQLYDP